MRKKYSYPSSYARKTKSPARHFLGFSLRILILAFVVVLTVVSLRAFDARRRPNLKVWHKVSLDSEFRAADYTPDFSLSDYLEMEERLFKELDEKVYKQITPSNELLFSRFLPGGPNDPRQFSINWNRSFELIPSEIRGGALLLHGLTDSPYSLRKVGMILKAQNLYVLGLRLPGHGTAPAALTSVEWRDWMAATTMAAQHVRQRISENEPFYLFGYSNGGALAVKYTLDAMENTQLAKPEKLILFSPAIGISPFASLAKWLAKLSFIPYLETLKWTSIEPEYDPFKYNSFPLNAGAQTYLLTQAIQSQLDKMAASELSQIPPILTFQSLVDSTVSTSAVIDRLYGRFENKASELVLFDINRRARLKDFFSSDHSDILRKLEDDHQLPYRLTILTNLGDDTVEVVERTRMPQSDEWTVSHPELFWPRGVYSLSHVAVPFSPQDPVYGSENKGPIGTLPLGSLEPRGEKDVLRVSVAQLMRLRHNPFFSYVEKRLLRFISVDGDGQKYRE